MRFAFVSLFIFFSYLASAQYLVSMHTEWDDSFKEWSIAMEMPDSTLVEGDMNVRWALSDDFASYDFRIGEYSGEIEQVFQSNAGNWQLRMGGELVSMRQVWPSDPREWKVSMGKHSFIVQTRYSESFDDWTLKSDRYGEFNVYSEVVGDVRDWIIDDYMSDDIPLSMRLAAAFVPIMISSPKI